MQREHAVRKALYALRLGFAQRLKDSLNLATVHQGNPVRMFPRELGALPFQGFGIEPHFAPYFVSASHRESAEP